MARLEKKLEQTGAQQFDRPNGEYFGRVRRIGVFDARSTDHDLVRDVVDDAQFCQVRSVIDREIDRRERSGLGKPDLARDRRLLWQIHLRYIESLGDKLSSDSMKCFGDRRIRPVMPDEGYVS